jgi:uncharacterized protein (TIGR04255 family)
MQFVRDKRVIYASNPLSMVVCQIRFSTLLELTAQLPIKFQQAIRAEYPMLSVAQNMQVIVNFGGVPTPAAAPASIPDNSYNFVSADGSWTINLSKDALTLQTTAYVRWEEFKDRLTQIFGAFWDLYGPIAVTRIGLRYQDILDREKHGLGDDAWSMWVKPQVLGLLADPQLSTAKQHQSVSIVALDDELGELALRVGLGLNSESGKQVFLIDADFYADSSSGQYPGSDIPPIFDRLDHFNEQAGGLFRWCITNDLHAKLKPTDP